MTCFREKYTNKKVYSQIDTAGSAGKQYITASRIDYIFVRISMLRHLHSVNIVEEDKISSDHRLVYAQIHTVNSAPSAIEDRTIKIREEIKDKNKW